MQVYSVDRHRMLPPSLQTGADYWLVMLRYIWTVPSEPVPDAEQQTYVATPWCLLQAP